MTITVLRNRLVIFNRNSLDNRACAKEKLGDYSEVVGVVWGGGVSKGRTTMATEQIRFSISLKGREGEEKCGKKGSPVSHSSKVFILVSSICKNK